VFITCESCHHTWKLERESTDDEGQRFPISGYAFYREPENQTLTAKCPKCGEEGLLITVWGEKPILFISHTGTAHEKECEKKAGEKVTKNE